ncbi:hypothetical protein HDV02_002913 [Globomyces sp. JEL0801]|nr:hypothetical protein HDV02_002913 [Globomyces sp. JEL0801]
MGLKDYPNLMNVFHVGVLANKKQVQTHGLAPHFKIVFTLEAGFSVNDLETLCSKLEQNRFRVSDGLPPNMKYSFEKCPHVSKMEFGFLDPRVVTLKGSSFEFVPRSQCWVLRHPRLEYYQPDKHWYDCVSFDDLQVRFVCMLTIEMMGESTMEEKGINEMSPLIETLDRLDLEFLGLMAKSPIAKRQKVVSFDEDLSKPEHLVESKEYHRIYSIDTEYSENSSKPLVAIDTNSIEAVVSKNTALSFDNSKVPLKNEVLYQNITNDKDIIHSTDCGESGFLNSTTSDPTNSSNTMESVHIIEIEPESVDLTSCWVYQSQQINCNHISSKCENHSFLFSSDAVLVGAGWTCNRNCDEQHEIGVFLVVDSEFLPVTSYVKSKSRYLGIRLKLG